VPSGRAKMSKVKVNGSCSCAGVLSIGLTCVLNIFKEIEACFDVFQNLPRFKLHFAGSYASLTTNSDVRVPVLMTDIQQLLMYAVGGNTVSHPPERLVYINYSCSNESNEALAKYNIKLFVIGFGSADGASWTSTTD